MSDQTSSNSRPVVVSGTTGSLCQSTGPYVYNNGYIEIVVFLKKGDSFPSAPATTAPPGVAKMQAQSATATWSMVSATGSDASNM